MACLADLVAGLIGRNETEILGNKYYEKYYDVKHQHPYPFSALTLTSLAHITREAWPERQLDVRCSRQPSQSSAASFVKPLPRCSALLIMHDAFSSTTRASVIIFPAAASTSCIASLLTQRWC